MALARPITAGSAAGVLSSWAYRVLLNSAYPPAPLEPLLAVECDRDLGWADFYPFLRAELAANWIALVLIVLLALFKLCNLRALSITLHLTPESGSKVVGASPSGKTRLSGYQ